MMAKFDDLFQKMDTLTNRIGTFESSLKQCIDNQEFLKSQINTQGNNLNETTSLSKEAYFSSRVKNLALLRECETNHTDCISKLILIENDAKYITCSDDRTIHIFNAENNQLIQKLQDHKCAVNDIIMLKNGVLASSSEDKSIKLWDITQGICIQTLISHEKKL